MNKNKQKRNTYNHQVINELSMKYAVTPRYIRMCLSGDRKGLFPDKIINEYKGIDKRVKDLLIVALHQ